MCEILTHIMLKGQHHEMGFLHLHSASGCFEIFEKHLKKLQMDMCVLQKDAGLKARIYSILLCFLLVGMASQISSAPYACFHWLQDLQIACTPTAGKFANTWQPLIKKISAASRSTLSLLN
jgi:hypothetical protein